MKYDVKVDRGSPSYDHLTLKQMDYENIELLLAMLSVDGEAFKLIITPEASDE